jgi:hypothetical protein
MSSASFEKFEFRSKRLIVAYRFPGNVNKTL